VNSPGPGSRKVVVIFLGAIAALMMLSARAHEAETKPRAQAAKPPLEFLGQWGTRGSGPEQMSAPFTLASDDAGSVFISDPGSSFVHKLTSRGEPLLSFQDLMIPSPGPLALDSGGGIYIADRESSRVFIFEPDGNRLREQRRGGNTRFKSVAALAADADGNIFVVELDAAQILKFDDRGRFRKAWGKKGSGPGQFQSPREIAAGTDGYLYVADQGNSRIQKFTREGIFVSSWGGGPAGAAGIKRPTGLAVNDRFVVATDERPRRIFVWTHDGVPLHGEDISARLASGNPEKRDTDSGIAFVGNNEFVVLDPNGPKVLRFRINL
jgi:DNA-binding beta-propeller fold protein YncE